MKHHKSLIEGIKALFFLEVVLAIEIVQEKQYNLKEKDELKAC